MKNSYRINVRFDLRKEREKKAAEYLVKLSENGSQTRNRFIVDAVTEAIRRKEDGDGLSLYDIRAMFREELKSVSVASAPAPASSSASAIIPELTEEEKAENDACVLSAVALF